MPRTAEGLRQPERLDVRPAADHLHRRRLRAAGRRGRLLPRPLRPLAPDRRSRPGRGPAVSPPVRTVKRPCLTCGRLIPPGSGSRCLEHKRAVQRAREAIRATPAERGYTGEYGATGTPSWPPRTAGVLGATGGRPPPSTTSCPWPRAARTTPTTWSRPASPATTPAAAATPPAGARFMAGRPGGSPTPATATSLVPPIPFSARNSCRGPFASRRPPNVASRFGLLWRASRARPDAAEGPRCASRRVSSQ